MQSLSRRVFLSCFFSAIAFLGGCASNHSAVQADRLVVFGDSNVDNGNLYRMTNEKFPVSPRWKGRDSNGPVVVEYLAKRLNTKLENYAVSGATTGMSNIVPLIVPEHANVATTGVAWQLDTFVQNGGKLGPRDLVVVWAGSNDIFGAKRQNKEELATRIATANANLDKALTRLYSLGARKIVVATRTPRDVLGSENDLNGLDLNTAVVATVKTAAARTGADIRLYDAYSAIADVMRNPARYGFVEATALCVAVPACVSENHDAGLKVANTFVNWDGAHKTTRVHQIMAEQIETLISR